MAFRLCELLVMDGGPEGYRLAANAPSQGRTSARVAPDLPPVATLSSLLERPTSAAELREIGTRLFASLFVDGVGRLIDRVLGEILADNQLFLRLVLRIDPPALAVLPWELLYLHDRRLFLASSPRTTLSRALSLMAPVRSIAAPKSLRTGIRPRELDGLTGFE